MRVRFAFTAVLAGVLTGAASAAAADVPPLPPLPDPLASLVAPSPAPAPASPPPEQRSAAAEAPAQTSGATTLRALTGLQRTIAAEINLVRRSHGRSRLAFSSRLARAGEEHARELARAGLFSHDWSDGTPFARWIVRYYPVNGARRWSAGENLAWSSTDVTAKQAVEMWLASPTHRRVLFDPRWREIGLGAIRADGAGGVFGGQSVVILAAEFGLRR